jgi:hypothetical protein
MLLLLQRFLDMCAVDRADWLREVAIDRVVVAPNPREDGRLRNVVETVSVVPVEIHEVLAIGDAMLGQFRCCEMRLEASQSIASRCLAS